MKNKYIIFTLFLAVFMATACSDVWDEHYKSYSEIKSNLNLYEYIKSQSDLSTFAQMIEKSGYDSILSNSQSYTVWAPVNSALTDIDMTDTVLVKNLVKNHISRFLYPTSDIETKTIYMLSTKFVVFKQAGTGYTFGGKNLSTSNTAMANGIVHTIDGYVPYLYNIWEFIGRTAGLDSLKSFLYSQSDYVFDEKASVEIGTNALNQAIYDSVLVFSNSVLDKIGQLQIEDSIYAAILPDNNAWTKIYNQIQSNYKTLNKSGGAEAQRLYTQWAIVENLVFRIPDMQTDPLSADSLFSTSGSLFNPSTYLFENSTKNTLSNGFAYITDSLRFRASDAWQKPITVEAEDSEYGRTTANSNLFIRSGLGSAYTVSENKYLVSEPTSVSKGSPNSVTFPLPNTLSGKYRIYCVFLPSSIISATDARQYKVKYNLSYLNSAGIQVNDAAITLTNTIATTTGAVAGIFWTDASVVTKMFVTQIEFPYCNIMSEESTNSDITVKLKVENAALITETVKYDRTLRIDYIILEPVQ